MTKALNSRAQEIKTHLDAFLKQPTEQAWQTIENELDLFLEDIKHHAPAKPLLEAWLHVKTQELTKILKHDSPHAKTALTKALKPISTLLATL
jgi:F0F1-type ATP synthase membrane subunit b/b'